MTNTNVTAMLVKGRIFNAKQETDEVTWICGKSVSNSRKNSRDLSSVPRVSDWLQRNTGDRGGGALRSLTVLTHSCPEV